MGTMAGYVRYHELNVTGAQTVLVGMPPPVSWLIQGWKTTELTRGVHPLGAPGGLRYRHLPPQ